jgi:hypothetical protein
MQAPKFVCLLPVIAPRGQPSTNCSQLDMGSKKLWIGESEARLGEMLPILR